MKKKVMINYDKYKVYQKQKQLLLELKLMVYLKQLQKKN